MAQPAAVLPQRAGADAKSTAGPGGRRACGGGARRPAHSMAEAPMVRSQDPAESTSIDTMRSAFWEVLSPMLRNRFLAFTRCLVTHVVWCCARPWGRHGLLDYLGELNGKLLYSYFNWRQVH